MFLEIGPGRGALTLPLCARVARVVAVELDPRLAAELRARAPRNLEIVVGDALAVDLASLVPAGSRVVGNLPYSISSPLLRRFLEMRGQVRDLHVMLQDEVARRIAAKPGSKEYGILSVLYGVACRSLESRSASLRVLSVPPPKVASAVLRAVFLKAPRAPVPDPEAPPKGLSRRPLPDAAGHLKTTCEIAILTSSST